VVHELIERFDGHLKAEQFYSVIANMRGETPEEVRRGGGARARGCAPRAAGISAGRRSL
jgi:hypothetical protein